MVTQLKVTYRSPYLVISGDFNQWRLEDALVDFADLEEAEVGPTRGSRQIDQTFTNFGDAVKDARTISPIQADDPSSGQPSDHKTTTVTVRIPRTAAYRWLKYSYRYYN